MNIIGAFDRSRVSDLVPRKNSVLIQITCLDDEFPKLNQKWTDILRLKFDDNYDGDLFSAPITDKQAKQILQFSIEHIDKDMFINCDAGISRSPAIVVALEQIFNSNDVRKAYPHYNRYVKNKITDVWFRNIWNG